MIDRFLGDAVRVLSCLFWSTVLQSGAWLPIHALNYWTTFVSGAHFLTGGVFECDIAYRRQLVAVLCLLYKIRCNIMHPLTGDLPGLYVPVRVTCGAVFAHTVGTLMHSLAAEPRSTCRTFIPLHVSLSNDLANPVLDGVGLAGFKSRANASLLA